MEKILKLIQKYNKEPWFRPVALLVVLLVIAFGVQVYTDFKDKMTAQEQSQTVTTEQASQPDGQGNAAQGETQTEPVVEKPNYLLNIWNSMKIHLLIFIGLAVALGIVKYIKALKLKERE